MKLSILKLIAVILSMLSFGQIFGQQKFRSTIVKTNLLNIPMFPSFHIEQQFGLSEALQFNLHYGFFEPYAEDEWLNTSLDYRHFFKNVRIRKIKGFYLSSGLNIRHDFSTWRIDENGNFLKQGISHLGLQLKMGYQWMRFDDRFVFDIGGGGTADFLAIQKTTENLKAIFPRLNVSVGVNLSSVYLHGKAR